MVTWFIGSEVPTFQLGVSEEFDKKNLLLNACINFMLSFFTLLFNILLQWLELLFGNHSEHKFRMITK